MLRQVHSSDTYYSYNGSLYTIIEAKVGIVLKCNNKTYVITEVFVKKTGSNMGLSNKAVVCPILSYDNGMIYYNEKERKKIKLTFYSVRMKCGYKNKFARWNFNTRSDLFCTCIKCNKNASTN